MQLARRQPREAEASFRKAIEVAPASIVARMALANFLWASARTSEAEQAFKDALVLDPTNLTANRALAVFYVASNRARDAEPFFQAIAAGAKTPAAGITLADYYVATRRAPEARKVLADLATNDVAYVAATVRLAAIDASLGERAAALSKLHEVALRHPREMSARLLAARVLLIDGKRDEALAQATSIVKDEPNSAEAGEAYNVIGRVQASLDRPEEAIRAYEEVLKRQSRPLEAQLGLASLHLTARDLDKATRYARDALAIHPNSPHARAVMVRIRLAANDTRGAAQMLGALRKDFPNSPAVLNLVAAQQLAARQVDAARASYARAAALAPNDLEAFSGLVRVDLTTGRTKDAVLRVEISPQEHAADDSAVYRRRRSVYGRRQSQEGRGAAQAGHRGGPPAVAGVRAARPALCERTTARRGKGPVSARRGGQSPLGGRSHDGGDVARTAGASVRGGAAVPKSSGHRSARRGCGEQPRVAVRGERQESGGSPAARTDGAAAVAPRGAGQRYGWLDLDRKNMFKVAIGHLETSVYARSRAIRSPTTTSGWPT